MFEIDPPNDELERGERPSSPRPFLPLSPTEKKVCALLLHRMTEKQIAEHLSRSPNTVHVHVRNIYRKLGIRARQHLYQYPDILSIILEKES